MQAIIQERYGSAENLRLAERDKPVPGPHDVLIRVRAAGVDPGVWHMVTGKPYFARLMGIGFGAPKRAIAGWDAAGVVEAVGAAVTRFRVGDEVLGNCDVNGSGTFAEYACLPESRCAIKPAAMSFEEAAALSVSGCTALQAVRNVANVREGSTVLVLGAGGGVGHYAVQIAKAFGATVTGVCGPEKVELVRSLGADEVIDYTREGLGERRWDAIIDTAGRRSIFELRRAMTANGVLAIVGGDGGNAWTGEFIERALVGAVLSIFSKRKVRMVDVRVNDADLQVLVELAQSGKLRAVIDRRYRLADAAAAVRELERGHARGKSVVVIDQNASCGSGAKIGVMNPAIAPGAVVKNAFASGSPMVSAGPNAIRTTAATTA